LDAEERERLLERLRLRRLADPPKLDMGKAISGALHSARLSGMDPDLLERMAEDAGVPWRNPDK
jgi:hypothetical protein